MSKELIMRPHLSEKAYGQSQSLRTYVFAVPRATSKQLIAASVAEQFSVTVTNVNVMNTKGKVKRTVRKSGRSVYGSRPDIKKAYVTLKEGDSIPIFAAEEEQEAKQEKTQQAIDKAAAKETAKDEQKASPKRFGIGRVTKRTGTRGNK